MAPTSLLQSKAAAMHGSQQTVKEGWCQSIPHPLDALAQVCFGPWSRIQSVQLPLQFISKMLYGVTVRAQSGPVHHPDVVFFKVCLRGCSTVSWSVVLLENDAATPSVYKRLDHRPQHFCNVPGSIDSAILPIEEDGTQETSATKCAPNHDGCSSPCIALQDVLWLKAMPICSPDSDAPIWPINSKTALITKDNSPPLSETPSRMQISPLDQVFVAGAALSKWAQHEDGDIEVCRS